MNNKIGLKLWSTNTDFYLKSAVELYEKGVFDFIELYVVPNSIEHLTEWEAIQKKYNIPFALHAPHFAQNVNLADSDVFEYNKQIFKEVEKCAKTLKAIYIVVHSGMEGKIEETVRQLKKIKPQNMLIENKPYRAPLGQKPLCRGYNIEEIEYVIKEIKCGFCLDLGHSICSANSLNINPYEYIEKFNKLNPACYHLSDGHIDSPVDEHLHLGAGTYDIKRICNIIDNDKNIAIETNKNSKENLDDFVKDVLFFKNIKQKG